MKLSEFKYNLPRNLIAKLPADPRNSSKLMVVNRTTGDIEDKTFKDIIDFIQKGDCVVMNHTKVFLHVYLERRKKPMRGSRLCCSRELKAEDRIWDVLVEPARKVRIGNKNFISIIINFIAKLSIILPPAAGLSGLASKVTFSR